MATSSTYADDNPNIVQLREEEEYTGQTLLTLALKRLSKDYLTLLAMVVILVLSLLSLAAPLISDALDVSYRKTDVANAFLPLGADGHPLGTDDLGRDQLARLLYGGRVSLGIALAAALLSLFVGASAGVVAGYYQGSRFGFIDDLILWLVTTLNSVPTLFLLLVISAMLSPSVGSLILILGLLSWSGTMRFVRGETLAQREREYIIAAHAVGASVPRVMFQHILPNIFSVIVINMASDIGGLILTESALSYLNLGVRPPTPSWGNMLINAQTFFTRGVHLVILPGTLIVVTVLCLFLIGDGVRDAFDPQASKKQI